MPGERSSSERELNPEFLKDLSILTSTAHDNNRKDYLQAVMSALQEGASEVSSVVQETFANEHNLKLANVQRAFRALTVLCLWISSNEETDEAFQRQFKTLEEALQADERIERFRALVSDLNLLRKSIKQGVATAQAVGGVLPMFEDILSSIDARAIWEGKDRAKLMLFPIASIVIRLDSGTPDRLTFQITEHKLDDLLKQLGEIKKQMRKLGESVNPKERT